MVAQAACWELKSGVATRLSEDEPRAIYTHCYGHALKDTEMKRRIIGMSTQMETFQYFFGITLGELILQHTDILRRTLQKSDISAAQGQEIAGLTIKTI